MIKKLILTVCCIAFCVLMAGAQVATKTPEQRARRMTRMLTKQLMLTPGQEQQVNAIFVTQATRMDSLRNNMSDDKKLNRLSAHAILLTSKQHIMAILNDTQKQQYIAWESAVKERRVAKRDTTGIH